VHEAFAPSTHWENLAQHPAVAQSHVTDSVKTEWQSVRVSQDADVASLLHGPGNSQPSGHVNAVLGSPHPANVRREQPVQ